MIRKPFVLSLAAAAALLACGDVRDLGEQESAASACGTCHGAPPAAPHAASTACGGCHSGYGPESVNAELHMNGRIDVGGGGGGQHAAGWGDPAQHGPAAKRDLASCQSCHGIAFSGGATGVSCNGCHGGAAWVANCTFCHGTKLATYSDADLAKAAPPRGANGETAPSDLAVGAHERHLAGGNIGEAVACAECHEVPTDLSHLDGTARVRFGPAASRGTSPTWNGATCASTYCHGATLAGGTRKSPSWTSGAPEAACGTCHGVAPATGRHAKHSGRSCGDCHPGYTSSSVTRSTHVDGAKQVGNRITAYSPATGSCTNTCHGSETWL